MKIGIIGQGFVGNAIYQKFSKYYNVLTYDLDESKCNSTQEEIAAVSDVVFVCLPTPMNQDGSCNIDIVEGVITQLNENYNSTVVIKSTIPPGTTDRLNEKYSNIDIVFNPEFLTEANAVDDFENQTRIVLGGSNKGTTKLKRIYSSIFRKTSKIIKTDAKTAELVKYVTNCFLSTKVSFANEIYQLCDGLGLDYDKVIEYATYDERLGLSHWGVPGPDGDFGFGGHCFPKDLQAIISITNELKITNNVLTATQQTNNELRNNRDWENMKGRAVV
ncbi:nucleotide sugar dehydrogenase [bacterium]|nr:nucleotide sugar dehydrogenase [bacterium]